MQKVHKKFIVNCKNLTFHPLKGIVSKIPYGKLHYKNI